MDLLLVALATLITLAYGFWPKFKPVDWADDLGGSSAWAKLVWGSTIFGGVLALTAGLTTMEQGYFENFTIALSVGVLSVALVYSVVTDYKLRMVDRRVLNLGSLLAGVPGIALLVSKGDWISLSVTAALLLFAAFVYLFVFSVGASDARAVCLVGLAAVPVIGWEGFVWASLFAGLFFMLVGFGVAFVKRTVRSSFPAVPMLLFPYWLVVVAELFINLPLMFPAYA